MVVEIAARYGEHPAIVFQHVHDWVVYNRKKNKNYKDGKYWMYQTAKDMASELQYLSEKQVENLLRKLVKDGLLIKENYNDMKIDKTGWYTPTDRGWELMQRYGNMDNAKKDNPCSSKAGAIPINKQNNNPEHNVVVVVNDENEEKCGNNEIELYEQYPVPKRELKLITQLLDKLWAKYYPAGSCYTRHDIELTVEYVYERIDLENGEAIAVYNSVRAELLKEAFRIAHEKGELNWAYIKGIYNNWVLAGVENVADYINHEYLRKLANSKFK